jgi:hypothetical protein
VPVVALLVLGLATVVSVLLWQWVNDLQLPQDKRATALLDVVKLTASIAVGGGGLFALYLAARRQRTQELELAQREKVQAHAEQGQLPVDHVHDTANFEAATFARGVPPELARFIPPAE